MKISEIKAAIYATYKKNIGYFIATAFAFVILIVAISFLDMFFQGAFVIGVFFLIIPFLGCMIFSNMQYTLGKPYDYKSFYQGYKISLLPGLHGSFRFIRSALFSFLILIGSFLLIYEVTSLFIPVYDAAIEEVFTQINMTESFEEANNMLNEFIESPTGQHYINLYSIMYLGAFGVSLFFFIVFILRSVLIFYIQSGLGCSKKEAIYLFNKIYPESKKLSNKLINSVIWPYYIIFPLSYALGAFVGWTIFKNLPLAVIIALALSLFASSFMLAPYLLTQDVLYHVYAPAYKVNAKHLFEEALLTLDAHPQLNEEQKEKLKEYYLKQLQEIEQIEKASTITNSSTVEIVERNSQIDDNIDKEE